MPGSRLTFFLFLIGNLELNSSLNFKITSVTECVSYESTFLRIVGISLGDCVDECGARLKCSSLNYHRLRQACLLVSDDDGSTSTSTTSDISTASSTDYDSNNNYDNDSNNSTISTTTIYSTAQNGSYEDSSSGSTYISSSAATTTYIPTIFSSDVDYSGSTTTYSITDPSTDCITTGGLSYCNNKTSNYETCILINKEDIQMNENCHCAINKVCRKKNGVYECKIEECDRFVIANAVIYGNMNTVGSIARYECNEPYKPTSNITVKCLPSGLWSPTPGCIVDCGEPTVGLHAKLDQGGTVVDDSRTVACEDGYALSFNQKLDIFTVTCQENGSWSMEKIECVKENRIGNSCKSDQDCANTESKCIYKKCFCDALYRWSNSSNDCVKACNTMSNNFTIYEDTKIKSYYQKNTGFTNIEDSKAICRTNPTCYHFQCLGNNHCRLGNVTIEMIRDADPDAIRERTDSTTWDVYSRNCV